MAARKTKTEDEPAESVPKDVVDVLAHNPPAVLHPGIVKEYTQNGVRYQRIRTEKGELIDVRI